MYAALNYSHLPGPGDSEPPEDGWAADGEHDEVLAAYLHFALEMFIRTHPEPLYMRAQNGVRFGSWIIGQLRQLSAASEPSRV